MNTHTHTHTKCVISRINNLARPPGRFAGRHQRGAFKCSLKISEDPLAASKSIDAKRRRKNRRISKRAEHEQDRFVAGDKNPYVTPRGGGGGGGCTFLHTRKNGGAKRIMIDKLRFFFAAVSINNGRLRFRRGKGEKRWQRRIFVRHRHVRVKSRSALRGIEAVSETVRKCERRLRRFCDSEVRRRKLAEKL